MTLGWRGPRSQRKLLHTTCQEYTGMLVAVIDYQLAVFRAVMQAAQPPFYQTGCREGRRCQSTHILFFAC